MLVNCCSSRGPATEEEKDGERRAKRESVKKARTQKKTFLSTHHRNDGSDDWRGGRREKE